MNPKVSQFFIAVLTFLSTSGLAAGLEIIAHRGASHDAPENTLAAIKQAWVQGADSAELDIRLTRDGQIVVIHDSTTDRTAGVPGVVAEMSFAEIKTLDVGAWKGEAFAGERMPLLNEVFAATPSGKRLYIELKCGREIVRELLRVLERHSDGPAVSLISFDWDLLRELKKKLPKCEMLWLRGYDANVGAEEAFLESIGKCKEANLDGVDLSDAWPLDDFWMKKFHDAGLRVAVWTVDDPKAAARFDALGVQGITTNRPQWLRQGLGKKGAADKALAH